MRTRMRSSLSLATLLVLVSARAALAAWPNQPGVNLKLSGATGDQLGEVIVSDGAGGAIVAWEDGRNAATSWDIYAQHVLPSGVVDPAWPADGLLLCGATGPQLAPVIVSDGAGGAIVAWYDGRFGNSLICAQHVLPAGIVDPVWTAANGNSNGTLVSFGAGNQQLPCIASDGAGGAIVAWQDYRTVDANIYAQHVLASGLVDPVWTAANGNPNGTLLCGAGNNQQNAEITSDDAGGAIVTWEDQRGGAFSSDIYAQHVLASGLVDPAWTAANGNSDGTPVCILANSQQSPRIVQDGAGGAIITWQDLRGGANYDIYAQHVLVSGHVDPSWTASGTLLCNAANNQVSPAIVSDGAGGAIVAWQDGRNGLDDDIYAQHVTASGQADPAWTANGAAVSAASNAQATPMIVSDGSGGAIVTWYDLRAASYDIYAQHVLASGAMDPAWAANGALLSNAANFQYMETIASDGAGGAIVAWEDFRNGADNDIYAQRIARYGKLGTPEAEIAGVADVPNDQGGKVKLSWRASYLESDPYDVVNYYNVFRSVPPNVAQAAIARGTRVRAAGDLESLDGSDLLETSVSGVVYFWELIGSVNSNFLTSYSFLVPTTGDSTGLGNPKTAFMVQARSYSSSEHWESLPALGYSVDNLAPVAPAPFAGNYALGATHLHWDPNTEADLAGYRLYRGSSSGFVPGPSNLVSALSDTGYADVGPAGSYYKLSAVDIHGNESPYALLSPSATTDVPGGAPLAFALDGVRPNPARGSRLSVAFTLPGDANATLELVDVSGRRAAALEVGALGAGRHEVDLAAGRRIAPGLYLLRLTQGANARVSRVMVIQ